MHLPSAVQCCVCSQCCLTVCLGQRGATCPPKSAPGLVSSHELLWGLTACLPWMPFPWCFCMVWHWLPVDGWRLYWISCAATKVEREKERERGKKSENKTTQEEKLVALKPGSFILDWVWFTSRSLSSYKHILTSYINLKKTTNSL